MKGSAGFIGPVVLFLMVFLIPAEGPEQGEKTAATDLQCFKEVEVSPGGTATLRFSITPQVDDCKTLILHLVDEALKDVWVFRDGMQDNASRHEKFKEIVISGNPCSGNFSVKLEGVDAHSGTYKLLVCAGRKKINCSISPTGREQPNSTPPTSTPPTSTPPTSTPPTSTPPNDGTPDKQGRDPGAIGGSITVSIAVSIGGIIAVSIGGIIGGIIWMYRKKEPPIDQGTGEEMEDLRGNGEPNIPAGREEPLRRATEEMEDLRGNGDSVPVTAHALKKRQSNSPTKRN